MAIYHYGKIYLVMVKEKEKSLLLNHHTDHQVLTLHQSLALTF